MAKDPAGIYPAQTITYSDTGALIPVFSLLISPSGLPADSSLLNLYSSTDTSPNIVVQTNDDSKAGTYTLMIRA